MKKKQNDKLTLRKISVEDIPFLFRVYASTRMEEMSLFGWPQQQIDWFLQMQFNLQHTQWMQNYKNADFNVILLDELPVGRLYLDHRETDIRIVDIAILPEFRGKGIGTHFLTQIKEMGKQKGVSLSLHVEKNNPARLLYERMGFQVVEEGDIYDLMEIRNS